MTKSTRPVAQLGGQKGQISIFFSASLIVLISIIAFVINVGLFVKAKINLQNATDAAAFSGAAVQARQLSKIAYLNWELRNIYKEWMYKYYVVGNLNVQDVETPGTSGAMNFRLRPDIKVLQGQSNQDPYNFPSVCIHVRPSSGADVVNLCKRFGLPGLPEFGAVNIAGTEQASRTIIDAIIGAKVLDCVERSKLNMYVALTWAYNVLSGSADTLMGRGPAILANRQGAWPRAVELAMRMRNLEFAANRPSLTEGVCRQPGAGINVKCSQGIAELESEPRLGNERVVKAFYSGWRNLGNDVDREMKDSFTLTEIAPTRVSNVPAADASNLLVPADKIYEKQYVDLKLMMVNLATFYTAFIPRAGTTESGACDVSKVAIPVPGYPLGFYKNPDVITYYAVKGEADFVGMFNPFNSEAIKLTAYSAAKPFGGRIGPALFVQRKGELFFRGRKDDLKLRSMPYISTLSFANLKDKNTGLAITDFSPGAPLPFNYNVAPGSFWLETPDSPLGGMIADEARIQFGVPNLVYDYQVPFTSEGYVTNAARIHTIVPAENPAGDAAIGLFSRWQFAKFRGDLGANVSVQQLEDAISRVRAPTLYEAGNYLIPTPGDLNLSKNLDSFGFIPEPQKTPPVDGGPAGYTAHVYAPLYSGDQIDVLYRNPGEVVSSVFQFMRVQKPAMEKYKISLNKAAKVVHGMGSATPGAEGAAARYTQAAKGISDIANMAGSIDQAPESCSSMAGQFLSFYYGHGLLHPNMVGDPVTNCPENLGTLLETYFNANDANFSPSHYRFDYSWTKENFALHPQQELGVFSAYMPGPLTGVQPNGEFVNPMISGQNEMMRRNFYSTKFVSLDSLQSGGRYSEDISNFGVYSEGAIAPMQDGDTKQGTFSNVLDPASAPDLSSIKY